MTSKIPLLQVGDTPICVGFADSAGPRGCSPILMNSLQAGMVLLANILCAVPIFTVCGSAFSRAGLSLAQAPGEQGWIDTASFPWGFLSAKSFRASNYRFSSRNFLFFSKESAVEHLTEASIAETCCFTRHSSCPRGKK